MGVCNCDTPSFIKNDFTHLPPGWVSVTYPHHQMAIESVKGRKRTSDPYHSKIGLGKGRKHTSDPRPRKPLTTRV